MSDRKRFAQKILAKKTKILSFSMFYSIYVFLFIKMSDSLIPSFLMSDVCIRKMFNSTVVITLKLGANCDSGQGLEEQQIFILSLNSFMF